MMHAPTNRRRIGRSDGAPPYLLREQFSARSKEVDTGSWKNITLKDRAKEPFVTRQKVLP